MKYAYGNVALPCNSEKDFETTDISVDIICRLFLKKAPDKEYEEKAKREDSENYNPACFFIECVAGKNEPNGDILTSDWLLYYLKEDGSLIEFGYVDDVPDNAWEYFLNKIGIKKEKKL